MENTPKKYLSKLNSKKKQIPIYDIDNKADMLSHLNREEPFIINYNLSHYLEIINKEITLIKRDVKIKTFDSIPYSEIREGYFVDYLEYVKSNELNNLHHPNGFKLIQSLKKVKISKRLRHYALSLDETFFPYIKDFKIPYLDDYNYLLQLNHNFFKANQIISPHWLFIHPTYSVSNAHYDHDCVHTAIFQLLGSKYAQLISPGDYEVIRNKDFPLLPNGFNDFTSDEIYSMPTNELTIWESDIEKNQILFIPCNWVHFILGLTSGISYSQDIVLKNNFDKWLSSILKSHE